MRNLTRGTALILATAAAALVAADPAAGAFGEVVGPTSADATHVLVALGLVPVFTDDDADGLFDPEEPVYLSPAAGTVGGNAVRIANPGTLPLGSQVRASESDFGNPTTALPGASAFHDADGDGLFTAGDAWVWDSDGSGTLSVGDVRMSGPSAGATAVEGDPDLDAALTATALQPAFFDADGDTAYTRGDVLYQDVQGDGFATVQDVRLAPWEGHAFGSLVALGDADVTYVLGDVPLRPVFVDADADGLFDGDEPVYLSPAAGTVRGNDVRIANPGTFARGSQVRAVDQDFGDSTVALPGASMFLDADGDTLFSAGDDHIWDTDASGTVTVNDLALSGAGAGDVIATGHADLNHILTAIAFLPAFFDADGDAGYGAGDAVYLDSDGSRFATVQDVRFGGSGIMPFGSVVARGDADATRLLVAVTLVPVFVDDDADGLFDGEEPVYLSPAAGTVGGNDVRIANPGTFARGSQVRASHSDFGHPTTAMPGASMFYDADGDTLFSSGDAWYWDTDASHTLTVNDLTLSGSVAGDVVARPHPDLNSLLTAIAFTPAFFDADGDTAYGAGDLVYQDSNADGLATVQDVRIVTTSGGGGGPPSPPAPPPPTVVPVPSPDTPENRSPEASIQPPGPVECVERKGEAVLDGTASRDPEGRALTIRWTADDGAIEWPDQPRTRATFPLGATTVHLAVSDGALVGVDSAVVRVHDTEAPATVVDLAGRAGQHGWWRSPVEVSLAGTDRCGVAATRYSLDGGPERTGDFLRVAGDGSHVVRYRTEDVAGNAEATQEVAIRVDARPPVSRASVDAVPGEAGWWRSPAVVRIEAADATSGVAGTQVRVAGGAWGELTARPEVLLGSEGSHTLRYRSEDHAGNREVERAVEVRIDSVAPSTAMALEGLRGEHGWWRSEVAAVLHGSDATSGMARIRAAADGGPPADLGSTTRITLRGDGVHTLAFHALDVAGNAEPRRTADVAIDATPPTTVAEVLGQAGDGGWWRSAAVELVLHASDAHSGVASLWHSVDGGPWTQGASATVEGDGVHEVRFFAVDVAGNREPARALAVRLDATPPSADAALRGLAGEAGWWRSDVAAAIAASDAASGVVSVHVAVDGGPFREANRAMLAGDGAHTLAFYAVDAAGNAGAPQVLDVPIDATPPRAAVRDPAPGTAYAFDLVVVEGLPGTFVLGDKTVRGAGADATSGLARLELWIDGVRNASARPDAGGEAAFLWAAAQAALGEHEVAIRAVDAAGNAASAALAVLVAPASPEGALATAERCEGVGSAAVCALVPDGPDAACRQALALWICDLVGDPRAACALALAPGLCALAPEAAPGAAAPAAPAQPSGHAPGRGERGQA